MNIQIQVTSFIFITLLIAFYMIQPKLGLYSERLYFHMLIICDITLALDFTSIITINYMHSIYHLIVEFICKTYLLFMILNGFYAFYYSVSDLDGKPRSIIRFSSIFLMALIGVFIFVLPIRYYSEGSVTYTLGPSVMATYICTCLFIVLTILVCIIFRKKMNPSRFKGILCWMIIWISLAGIQFFNNGFLGAGLGLAIGNIILFFFLENPDSNIDKNLDCFNSNALQKYLTWLTTQKKSFSIIIINFQNDQKKNLDSNEIFINWLIEKSKMNREIRIFKSVQSEMWLVFEHTVTYDSYRNFIISNIQDKEKQIILVPDSRIFSSYEEMTKVIQYTEVDDIILKTKGVRNITIEDIMDYNAEKKIKNDIADALKEDRIEIYIQPIYSTKTDKFTSGEVLVRMRTREGLIIPPGVFIPVAERSGLIKQVGEVVFRKACNFISSSSIKSIGLDYLEINLSVEQGESNDLIETFTDIMEQYHVSPSMLNLEITETGSIKNREAFIKNIEKLRAYGIEISLDDFGSGESNLDYIIQMPVSIVKFDKQMIDAYAKNTRAKFVMQHITNMAHEMGLKIVAEGIETSSQLAEMKRLGIDYIQGYYFSKPLPINDFITFVVSNM